MYVTNVAILWFAPDDGMADWALVSLRGFYDMHYLIS